MHNEEADIFALYIKNLGILKLQMNAISSKLCMLVKNLVLSYSGCLSALAMHKQRT